MIYIRENDFLNKDAKGYFYQIRLFQDETDNLHNSVYNLTKTVQKGGKYMVVLKNIVKNDKYISCDYYPEGKVVVDVKDSDKFKITKSNYDKDTKFFSAHVLYALWDFLEEDIETPKEKTIMWY